ncbi:hypothetical protein N7524_005284 [Penicillium chrysogenum]|nr:hypothetical protein N7524_005284 [Penicillium chrysogenum]
MGIGTSKEAGVGEKKTGDSRGVPLLRPEYAAGFRVDAAVLKSRPSMVNENGETRREQVLGDAGKRKRAGRIHAV